MSRSIDFDQVEWLCAGAVGQPGARVFLFQFGSHWDHITIKIEKAQLIGLSQAIVAALADLSRPHELPGEESLHEPFEPEWVAQRLELSLDPALEQFEIVAVELVPPDTEPARASTWVTKEQAAQLAIQTTRLVEQGRPPCPLCGYPLDSSVHSCPRTNGHSAPTV